MVELAEREKVNVRAGLDSYYFDFEPTCVPEVDLILGAICWAGKMYHSTASWPDPDWNDGPSQIDNIQHAANVCAAALRAQHGEKQP
jgi:hypothetical protein